MKLLPLMLAVAATAVGFCSVARASSCERNANIIDARSGFQNSGEVKFSYQSTVQKWSDSAHQITWCIAADASNQNIAEFKWGDGRREGRYLSTLIEPGQGASSGTTDASAKIHGMRIIKYRRKNRNDWEALNVDTLSSSMFGYLTHPEPTRVQLKSPNIVMFDPYKGEDGLIQIDRLSTNKNQLLLYIKYQGGVIFSGGSLTTTLPANAKVADLLAKNAYEKYEKEDFLRVNVVLSSQLFESGGDAQLEYLLIMKPASQDDTGKFAALIKTGAIRATIFPEDNAGSAIYTSKGRPINDVPLKLAQSALGTRMISFSHARMEISFGDRPAIAGLTSVLFVPN